jgi:hypothetical protein
MHWFAPKRRNSALLAALIAGLTCAPLSAYARETDAPIVFVPLDDRPVTRQLPQMLAEIAGVDLRMPPRPLLGSYLHPGNSEALGGWLLRQGSSAQTFVLSADMLAYGGLIGSRAPSPGLRRVLGRLSVLEHLRRSAPQAEIDVFGSVMRLAPTGVPRIGEAAEYFASGSASEDITQYANLPEPQTQAADRRSASELRNKLGSTLRSYLRTRRRDLHIDQVLLDKTARKTVDGLVLGQDDAGPVGLHIADLAKLHAHIAKLGFDSQRATLEPGTDELGMMTLARALALRLSWTPRVSVTYSRPGAELVHDPIEYEAIDPTIGKLIAFGGGRRVMPGQAADIDLFVYLAGTDSVLRATFLDAMAVSPHATVADLSFIGGTLDEQSDLIQAMIVRKLAARVDGFASWNTDANSVGTALAAAVFRQAGQMLGHENETAHAAFLLDRYADDYAYRTIVREQLKAVLWAEEQVQTYLLPGTSRRMENDARMLLWPEVVRLRDQIFPTYALCRSTITLPWQRTFEVELQLELKPGREAVETLSNGSRSCRPRTEAASL